MVQRNSDSPLSPFLPLLELLLQLLLQILGSPLARPFSLVSQVSSTAHGTPQTLGLNLLNQVLGRALLFRGNIRAAVNFLQGRQGARVIVGIDGLKRILQVCLVRRRVLEGILNFGSVYFPGSRGITDQCKKCDCGQ